MRFDYKFIISKEYVEVEARVFCRKKEMKYVYFKLFLDQVCFIKRTLLIKHSSKNPQNAVMSIIRSR